MKRFAFLLFLLLVAAPLGAGDYLGAESIGVDVVAITGGSALVSLSYTSYSPSMSGSLVPETCCLLYTFYVNSSGAYLLGESFEKPLVYGYRGFKYVFLPLDNGSIEVYRLGENCFERILSVDSGSSGTPNFAVSPPYLVVQVGKELVSFNVAKGSQTGRKSLEGVSNGSYFRGVTVVLRGGEVVLKGETPEGSPKPVRIEITENHVALPNGRILQVEELEPYLWSGEEVRWLRAYKVGHGFLLVPPALTHRFASNASGEILEFGNFSTAPSGSSELYLIYAGDEIRGIPLGRPTGTGFEPVKTEPSFRKCPRTSEVARWIGVGLILLLGLLWMLTTRK